MRILLLTARRLRRHPDAVAADDVVAQVGAELRSHSERGVAHVVVSHLSAERVEFAVFLHAGTSAVPGVGEAVGWVIDNGSPHHDLW